MKVNKLRMLASQKGFTLIELMIVIAIIGILAAVAIPNFIEYKNKSYCTATVNDANAIGGALADYFANPANITASTAYSSPGAGARPYILVGKDSAGAYKANTLLLSASTSLGAVTVDAIPTIADPPPADGSFSNNSAAAGAVKSGSNYIIFAIEGAGNCPLKITNSDTHWSNPGTQAPRTQTAGTPAQYFKTL